jgi:HSP20 family protein
MLRYYDMNDYLRGFLMNPPSPEAAPEIKIDVEDSDREYVVTAEIPGVQKNNIHVAIEGNRVSISAQGNQIAEGKDSRALLHGERYRGLRHRTFSLAADVDETRSSAKYEDGILALTLPKRSGAQSKQLNIQ